MTLTVYGDPDTLAGSLLLMVMVMPLTENMSGSNVLLLPSVMEYTQAPHILERALDVKPGTVTTKGDTVEMSRVWSASVDGEIVAIAQGSTTVS